MTNATTKRTNDETTRPARLVVVTGFMGAGKTTVARALSRRLSCTFVDLDQHVTEREGRTPQAIIDEDGEALFRDAETRALEEIIETTNIAAFINRPLVVALGGGTWTLERNRALVEAARALVVWLDAPFELCWRRIRNARTNAPDRPLARDPESARALYARRRDAYALASLRVEVSEHRSAEDLASEIAAAARCC